MEFRGHLRPRFVDALNECQYRLFNDGAEYTFNEDDVFLGGASLIYDYKAAGVTRAEAIAEIEMVETRVWLAEVLPDGEAGELVEQPLMRTAYKNFIHDLFGLVVYQQRGFITQLPPGDYVSTWVARLPEVFDETATVYLHILPTSG